MPNFVFSALLCGLRSRSFQIIFVLGLLLVGGAYLASMFSPRQPQTVALDVGFSGLRLTLVLLALFWVQELFSKEIEGRSVVLALAYPVSRTTYVLGRYCGIAALLALATLMIALPLWLMVMLTGGDYPAARPVALGLPYWATIGAVYLDVLVVTAFALCLACLSTVLILPLALGAIFAIVGHAIGPVVEFLLVRQGDGDAQMTTYFGPVIRWLRWILPDLSRLDWRDWALYQLPPQADELFWSVTMGAAFAALLLALGIKVFQHREFS